MSGVMSQYIASVAITAMCISEAAIRNQRGAAVQRSEAMARFARRVESCEARDLPKDEARGSSHQQLLGNRSAVRMTACAVPTRERWGSEENCGAARVS